MEFENSESGDDDESGDNDEKSEKSGDDDEKSEKSGDDDDDEGAAPEGAAVDKTQILDGDLESLFGEDFPEPAAGLLTPSPKSKRSTSARQAVHAGPGPKKPKLPKVSSGSASTSSGRTSSSQPKMKKPSVEEAPSTASPYGEDYLSAPVELTSTEFIRWFHPLVSSDWFHPD